MKGRPLLAQAARLGGLTLFSSGLGFVRELLIARKFGASHATDAYLVAISIPTLLYGFLFGSGLNICVIPRLSVLLRENGAQGRAVFAQFLSAAAVWSAAATCILLAFPGLFVRVFAPGLAQSLLATNMLRALAPMLFLFVITYALGSFHCSNDQVAHWGLIPVSLNLTVVASLAIFGSRWGIDGLAAATVAGGLLAFLLQARLASGDGFKEPWTRPFSAGPGRDILAGLAAFALVGGLGGDFGTAQADLFLVRFFASRLGPGTITLLALGNKLMALPVLLVGAALGLALLPSVSLALASQDHAKAGRQLSQALCCAFLLVFPFAIGYFDLGASVAQVIFCHTALQPAQLGDLGQILRAYSGAVIGMAGMFILNTYLAALRRTRALILIGIFAVVADAGLMWSFCDLYGAKGIALAVSLGSFLYCVALAAIVLPELPWAVRWILVQRIAVIAVGALGMHVFLVGAARINVFASVPWLGGTVLPLLVGVMAYLGWLALHHKRLQLAIRGA